MAIKEITNLHPCFNKASTAGRMHLPVCPSCNIFCKFCDRKVDASFDEVRPGVSSTLIAPEDAGSYVDKALKLSPEIAVIGIAGPGDTLATDHALRAFHSVSEKFPDLIRCMSTNGLLLNEKIDAVIAAGINTLTVTVNAVNPHIQSELCSGIVYHGKLYKGEEAAFILIRNQLEGIKAAAAAGITLKVNTVLVPGINDRHISEIARQVSKAGATIYNIIPLIPQHLLRDIPEPTCEIIDTARSEAEVYLPVFRHCQHCRADAIGRIGGEDFGKRIYQSRTEETFSHG